MAGRSKIILPNGEARVDYIRRRFQELTNEGFEGSIRGKILSELKEMGHETTYQVVFQATKPKKTETKSPAGEPNEPSEASANEIDELDLPE